MLPGALIPFFIFFKLVNQEDTSLMHRLKQNLTAFLSSLIFLPDCSQLHCVHSSLQTAASLTITLVYYSYSIHYVPSTMSYLLAIHYNSNQVFEFKVQFPIVWVPLRIVDQG